MLSKAYRRYVYCIEWMASIQNTPTRLEPTIRHFSVFFDRKKRWHSFMFECSVFNSQSTEKWQDTENACIHRSKFFESLCRDAPK